MSKIAEEGPTSMFFEGRLDLDLGSGLISYLGGALQSPKPRDSVQPLFAVAQPLFAVAPGGALQRPCLKPRDSVEPDHVHGMWNECAAPSSLLEEGPRAAPSSLSEEGAGETQLAVAGEDAVRRHLKKKVTAVAGETGTVPLMEVSARFCFGRPDQEVLRQLAPSVDSVPVIMDIGGNWGLDLEEFIYAKRLL